MHFAVFFYEFQILQAIWKILACFLIFVMVRMCIFTINYAIWMRKISKTVPGTKMRFFNLLGNVSELPFRKKSRNELSILIHVQQLLLGYQKLMEQEKLYCLWMFFFPVLILPKAEAVEAIYSKTKTIQKPYVYQWLNVFLGNGLITSSGDEWKSQRKMLNPCFRSDILKEHLQVINEQARILVKRLKKETERDFTKISKYLSDCTFDIICETIYGVKMGAQESKIETATFVYSVGKGSRLIAERFFNAFLWPDFLFDFSETGKQVRKHSQIARDFTKKLIDKEKQNIFKHSQTSVKKEKSLIKLLLKDYFRSKDMNEEEIRDQLMTFMSAGQDTTKTALSWILYILGLHADIQEKVHEELDLIFCEDHERQATMEDLKFMKYLDCVIKETLRLYPPVPFFLRCINEDTTICGYQIPKGTTCIALPHVLHRDEKVFPNPEKFDPDRFLPENSTTLHKYAYIPFSAGPRICIGKQMAVMELLTIASTILREYTVETLDFRDKVLPTFTITTASSKPLRIRIRPRHLIET